MTLSVITLCVVCGDFLEINWAKGVNLVVYNGSSPNSKLKFSNLIQQALYLLSWTIMDG